MFQQIPLDLYPAPGWDFAQWVPGSNREALAAVQNLQAGELCTLWSRERCGRTHLLRAALSSAKSAICGADTETSALPPEEALIAWDDVHLLNQIEERRLFWLMQNREYHGYRILLTANVPPAELPLGADVVTRLNQGLVYQLHPLMDEERETALELWARSRGIVFPHSVTQYILQRLSRDIGVLASFFTVLDRASLMEKRPVTLPLVRELIQSSDMLAPCP